MTDAPMQTLLSIGGYVISLLLGIVIFLMKREMARQEEGHKTHDARLAAVEQMSRDKWEKHAEKHSDDTSKLDDKREHLNGEIQKIRTELLEHCTEASERFLTKDEFVSSTTYLTKKTDEVSRLLQSIENVLARR